ncbi:MAG: S-layer protein domain-containing protein [Methanothrix sp.]|nr:S-layer protein domain-containing protein [Methanothrix sp.]
MHHVRVGGVCLLVLMIAAALPINVLAQASETASSSPSGSDAAAGGAAKTISQSLLSKSTQEETISAEKMAKSNRGLKPLGSSGQSAKSEASATSNEDASSETQVANTETDTTATSTEAVQDSANSAETATTESTTVEEEPATTSTETTAAEEQTVTPDEIEKETAAASTTESLTDQEEDNVTESAAEVAATSVENASVSESENATDEVETAEDETAENETADEEEDDEKPADRIWREGTSDDKYTWDYRSFSGFFYDMENDVGTEELTVNLAGSSRTIDSDNLVYKTSPKDLDFKYGYWGDYQVIGFMAEKYFAGYIGDENGLFSEGQSFLNEGQLRQVLIDNDDSQTLASGSALTLEEGYELQIKQIDIDGEKVYLGLSKDGEEIDSKVVSPEGSLKSSTYEYKVEVSGEDVPIIMAHIESVFASTENDLVTVDGLFQLSDTYASVEDGDEYGKMNVQSVDENGVEMNNEDSINLKEGSTVNIFGEVGFIVADADELRFAPIVDRIGPQEVRGTVINPSTENEFTWTVYNFEGFYYDIDEDVGTETLTAKITDGKKIEEGDLVYSSEPQRVDFEFGSWGKYDVIGFMADKYFAGYNNETEFTDEFSVIGESQLRKVLVDNDDSQTLASGSALSLEDGYELRIKSVDLNGNKVYLALGKDGEEVDSKVVTPSSDPGDRSSNYLYKVDIGSEEVPIVAVHIESVFRSTESDLATIDGIFQVSDSPESVEDGEVHGKMEVKEASSDRIVMENDGSFSLSRDKTIEIMDNLKFVVADSADRLMAPVATKGTGMDLTLTVPDAVVDVPVTISVKFGTTPLAGVQILMNGSSIGTTSVTGSFSYTPSKVGTYQVVAKKKDYNSASANLVVRTASEAASVTAYQKANATLSSKLTINAPAEVIKGENFLITVVQGINQTPVDGAEISIGDESIGKTGSQGTLTYSSNLTGDYTLKAEKEGATSATKKISIASSLKVIDLILPENAYAGSDMKISAVVENTGSKEDTRLLDLKVNKTVVDSKNASAEGGKNTTISFTYKPANPGSTEFSVDDLSKTINVETPKSKTWLIALIVVLLIAIGAGYYLYSKGELDSLQRQVKKMMQGR